MAQPQKRFADQTTWQAHLDQFGFTGLEVTPDPVRIATKSVVWSGVQSHKFLCESVVPSDDAGQFNVGPGNSSRIACARVVLDTRGTAGA